MDIYTEQQIKNLTKLVQINTLRDYYEDMDIPRMDSKILLLVLSIINGGIIYQPFIAPYADNSGIQFEYEFFNKSYLEFDFGKEPKCEVMLIPYGEYENTTYQTISEEDFKSQEKLIRKMNEIIKDFYNTYSEGTDNIT